MPTSSVSSRVEAWAISKFERADGKVFYQSTLERYDPNDKDRATWETLRCRYCMLSKHDDISDQYKIGLPIPKNLVIANRILLSKILLKEVGKWLKEQF